MLMSHPHTGVKVAWPFWLTMPPGSVGKTTRATFEQLSKRGQEWGDWQEQEEIARLISEFRGKEKKREHGPT